MLATQRQLTALVLLTMAVLLTACGAAGRARSDAGADVVAPEGTAATGATTSALIGTTSVVAPADPTPAEPSADPAALSGEGSGAASEEGTGDGLDAAHDALDRGDVCGVYAGLASFELSATSNDGLSVQMRRIRDIMVGTADIAPASLRADWQTLTDGTADMLESLNGDGGGAAADFDDDSYRAASQRVESWIGAHCG